MNEESLFHLALQQPDAAARAAFLDQACANQPELRVRLGKLLQAHDAPAGLFDKPAAEADTSDDASPGRWTDPADTPPPSERPGTRIGPYKLMEQIGEGGMGLVFVAEQQQPVRRKVALKVIKPGMDSRQVIARFEAERQALAMMDHPNIAKVHDGGETASGRPYFVMELVKGVPITEFCDQNQVPIGERLELFLHVCQAIQHAHQKGIIHRDVKPSNVLIMSQDGTPLVKVIDFGVAKAISQQLTDKTLYTQFAAMVGTPLYMSPEQAGQSGIDVDTRSDIYSLGVLLYELLTGMTPFDKERLREAGYDEMRRIIREEEPPRPSTRISTLGQEATTVCTNRKSDPKQLSRLCRGELDWIVMKCLEKDRNRRYETANGLARDIERYLHEEPVQACPPSAWYRLRKLARRNRAALVTTILIAAALLSTVVALVISYISISREEKEKSAALIAKDDALKEKSEALIAKDDALKAAKREEKEKSEALVAKDAALKAADTSRQQAEANLTLILAALDEVYIAEAEKRFATYRNEPRKLAVTQDPLQAQLERDFLQKGMVFYEKLIQPGRAEPSARFQTGKAYRRVGMLQRELKQHAKAVDSLAKAISLLNKLAEESPAESQYRLELAHAYRWQGVVNNEVRRLAEMERAYRRAIALADQLVAEFPASPDYRNLAAYCHVEFGMTLRLMGQSEKAEAVYLEGVKLWQQLVKDFPKDRWYRHELAYNLDSLGWLLQQTANQPEKAEPWFRKALKYHEELIAEDPTVADNRQRLARTHEHLAQVFMSTGQLPEAEKSRRAALVVLEKLVTEFPANTEYQPILARNYDALLQLLVRGAQEADKDSRLSESARKATAQAYFDKIKETQRQRAKRFPNDPEALNDCAWQMASDRDPRLRDPAGAVELAKRAVDLAPRAGRFWTTLGVSQYRAGDDAKAIEALTHALTLNGANGEDFLFLAMAHWQRGQKDEARQWYQAAVLRMQLGLPYQWDPEAWQRLRREAEALVGLDQGPVPAAAQAKLYDPECYTRIIAAQPEAAWAYQLRGQIYRRSGKTKQADADARRAAELLIPNLPTGPGTLKELERAAMYYCRANNWDMGIIAYSKAIELKDDEIRYYRERGWAYLVCGQYAEAATDYTKAIALNSRSGDLYARRGYVYLRCGEHDKALADHAKVLELNPDYAGDGWSRGCALRLRDGLRQWKDGHAVAALVEKLVGDFPNEPRYAEELWNTHRALADNFIVAGHLREGEKFYSEAIKHKPDDAMLWLRRAEFYGRLGLWDLAAKDSAAAFKLQPPATPNLCLNHAVLSLYVGDMASYRHLCALIPKHFGPDTDYRGWDSELPRACAIGTVPEADVVAWAVQRAERGVKRDPGAPWNYCALGRAYFRAGQYEQAVTQLKQAFEVKGNWYAREALTYPVLAMAYHHLGQADKAKEALEKVDRAIDQLSDRLLRSPAGTILPTTFWNNWVECRLLYREARTLIDGSPPADDPRWHVARANAFAALDQQQKAAEAHRRAVEAYDRAIQLKPDDPELRLRRAEYYIRSGSLDLAGKDAGKLMKLEATTPELRSRLVRIYVEQAWKVIEAKPRQPREGEKVCRQGIATVEQMIARFPKEVQHSWELADLQDALGWALQYGRRPADAAKVFREEAERRERLAAKSGSKPEQRWQLFRTFRALGIALDSAGRPKEAIESHRQALKVAEQLTAEFPKEARYEAQVALCHVNLGWLLLQTDRPQEAESHFSKAVELRPSDVLPWHNRARIRARLGQWEKAIADYSRAIELKPAEPSSWYDRGSAYYNLQQYDIAIADYSKAIELKEDYAEAWNDRGAAHGRLKETEKAIADYSQAIQLKPDFTVPLHNRASQYAALDQWEKAAADFAKLCELQPKDWRHRLNLAHVLAKLGRRDEARTEAAKVIEVGAKDAAAWIAAGNLYRDLGALDDAIRHYDKAMTVNPDEADAWYQRGRTRVMRREWDLAVADFSATIERAAQSPGLWLAYRERAGAYSSLHQFAKALADYEKAVQLTPKNGEAHNNLAWFLATCPEAKYRDAARAVESAKKAVQLAPKDGNNWGTLGTAHYRAGQWKEAIAALDKSRALKPGWDAYAWLFLAMTHRKLGHDDESRKAYDQAIDWLESNQELLAKNKTQVEELRRFRREAEEVLELKKK